MHTDGIGGASVVAKILERISTQLPHLIFARCLGSLLIAIEIFLEPKGYDEKILGHEETNEVDCFQSPEQVRFRKACCCFS